VHRDEQEQAQDERVRHPHAASVADRHRSRDAAQQNASERERARRDETSQTGASEQLNNADDPGPWVDRFDLSVVRLIGSFLQSCAAVTSCGNAQSSTWKNHQPGSCTRTWLPARRLAMAGAPPRPVGRLTADLILSAPQGLNAVQDYSIELRGAQCSSRRRPARREAAAALPPLWAGCATTLRNAVAAAPVELPVLSQPRISLRHHA